MAEMPQGQTATSQGKTAAPQDVKLQLVPSRAKLSREAIEHSMTVSYERELPGLRKRVFSKTFFKSII